MLAKGRVLTFVPGEQVRFDIATYLIRTLSAADIYYDWQ
jgi:hypothetical protein